MPARRYPTFVYRAPYNLDLRLTFAPQSIENCTKPLGPLRQSVFACLSCNPPPENPSDPYEAAGVCYACSVQCHGEHTLVEIFNKRNFTCDCGTTRLPATSPCSLRVNSDTNTKGGVHSEAPDKNNKYNQNFRNRFCGCECDYDPFQQKGTMFQCLGLGTHEDGGCGEDWWHPGCVVGLGPKWYESAEKRKPDSKASNGHPANSAIGTSLPSISEDGPQDGTGELGEGTDIPDEDDFPMPPGFPAEENFEGFLCYKCVDAYPWIKKYAGTAGFLPAVFLKKQDAAEDTINESDASRKRKAEDDDVPMESQESKRVKSDEESPQASGEAAKIATAEGDAQAKQELPCKLKNFPPAPAGQFSLFFTDVFRQNFCRCDACFPLLQPHPQLLEEEDAYEPPVSEDGSQDGASTAGSGSLYERGESALRNVDRVRAIEGVMAYNHLKSQLTPFFKQFAESGQAISAEDIKEYFAKLRGDEQAIKDAGEAAKSDNRKEQSGY
jgi:E3 ubiquitin-protein ligase UBR7